jgi:Galactoside-binding lectin
LLIDFLVSCLSLSRVIMKPIFSSKLTPVETGQVITILAKIKSEASRFEIELTEATDESFCEEIAFQVSVRFGEDDEIVRNSHTMEVGWGAEERMENLIPGNIANPFKPGDTFKLSIFIDVELFFVSINNKPFCTYSHRSDVTRIRRLNILNDVEKIHQIQHETVQPKQNLSSFRTSISRCFNIGDIFVIKGKTSASDQGSVEMNIFDEDLKRRFFHMKAELSSGNVQVNSQCSNHNWLEEQQTSPSPFPFDLDCQFKIAIVIKESDFTLVVNGEVLSVLAFTEDIEKVFSTMNGIEIIARDETKVEVESFEHFIMEDEDEDFESWAANIIY